MAAAAYRAGECLWDLRRGQEYDYTRRRAEMETFIVAPEEAAEELRHRETLWNGAESRETRKNSRTAHEFRIALPVEFNEDEQRELIQSWVEHEITSRGAVADVAIHRDEGNPHAHVMATTRAAGADGLGAKVREWDDIKQYDRWRSPGSTPPTASSNGQVLRNASRAALTRTGGWLKSPPFTRVPTLRNSKPGVSEQTGAARTARSTGATRSASAATAAGESPTKSPHGTDTWRSGAGIEGEIGMMVATSRGIYSKKLSK